MKFINGMANISIKSMKFTPFGGIYSIMEQFDSKLSSVIDSTLGIRCGTYGYQYSEIIRLFTPWSAAELTPLNSFFTPSK